MRKASSVVLFICLLAVGTLACAAQPQFPPLSGRVVDQAGLLSQGAERKLTAKLAAHEQATSQQLVVVTLKSLDGLTIDQYGYRLGRHWGIGQKGKDNGSLLIVAPNERKVRIEVGYGLEGTLTDALSFNIIDQVILPKFRKGQMQAGIVAGTDAILSALGGHYTPTQAAPQGAEHQRSFGGLLMLLMLGLGFLPMVFGRGFGRGRHGGHGLVSGFLLGSMMGGGFGGGLGGGGGGGFGGGGGGFGGGGAGGGW